MGQKICPDLCFYIIFTVAQISQKWKHINTAMHGQIIRVKDNCYISKLIITVSSDMIYRRKLMIVRVTKFGWRCFINGSLLCYNFYFVNEQTDMQLLYQRITSVWQQLVQGSSSSSGILWPQIVQPLATTFPLQTVAVALLAIYHHPQYVLIWWEPVHVFCPVSDLWEQLMGMWVPQL